MSGVTFTSKIKNEAALYKNLDDVQQAIKSANKKSLKRIAEKTVDRAKQKLIEHNTIRTGALINSIKIGEKGLDKDSPYISVYADYPDLTLVNKDRKTPLPDKTYYAFAVEYGTKEMYAQPYLQPAKKELEDTLPDLFTEALEEELK